MMKMTSQNPILEKLKMSQREHTMALRTEFLRIQNDIFLQRLLSWGFPSPTLDLSAPLSKGSWERELRVGVRSHWAAKRCEREGTMGEGILNFAEWLDSNLLISFKNTGKKWNFISLFWFLDCVFLNLSNYHLICRGFQGLFNLDKNILSLGKEGWEWGWKVILYSRNPVETKLIHKVLVKTPRETRSLVEATLSFVNPVLRQVQAKDPFSIWLIGWCICPLTL